MNYSNSVRPTVDLSMFTTQHPSSEYNQFGKFAGHKVTPSSVNEPQTTEFPRQEKRAGKSNLFCRSVSKAGYGLLLMLEMVTKVMAA